jgi:hypothetical protein
LELVQDGDDFYLFDPARRERLLTPVELAHLAETEAAARVEADRRAQAAEAEAARLRAELEALRQRPSS